MKLAVIQLFKKKGRDLILAGHSLEARCLRTVWEIPTNNSNLTVFRRSDYWPASKCSQIGTQLVFITLSELGSSIVQVYTDTQVAIGHY